MATPDLLKNFFNALPESAQGGADVSAIYVNRSQDAEHDPVANLKQCLEWEEVSGCYLFSGLRGSGKTTELNHLISQLREAGIQAFYCDASLYLNLNDPEISLSDLVMTALAGLSDAVRREFGADCLKRTLWDKTWEMLNSEVKLKPKLKAPIGTTGAALEIEATLAENPDFRKALSQFAQSSSAFYDEAGRFADELVQIIRAHQPDAKVVLVVDSLERLSAPSGDEGKLFSSLKQVFFNEPARLRFANLSTVYTVPPYLDAVLPGVHTGFTRTESLPNFKVIQEPSQGQGGQNPEGIGKMVQVVQKHSPDWWQVLSEPVLQHLAWMSGGNTRLLFKMLRTLSLKAAISKAPLPIHDIDAPSVRQALSEAAQPLQWLTKPDREWLKHFQTASRNPSQHITNLEADLPSIIRLFDSTLVLNYKNGDVWYQMPQLVRQHV